jgi:hypothetical protein
MKIKFSIVLLLQSIILFGQGEIDDQDKIFYRNERTYAFLLNSNGFGGNFRYAKRIDAFQKTLYEVEINVLKHPKEQKVLSLYEHRYIYGKLNSVYTLKGSVGYQNEMYRKRDLGGISIRYFGDIGPTLAFLKPVYYQYIDIYGNLSYDKFQNHKTVYDFVGKGPWSMGLDEISLSPGLYSKIGFSFEYSRIDAIFHALEVGVGLEAYLKKISIMDTAPDKILFLLPDDHFFVTLFISYRFGKVIDTKFNPRRTKIDDLIAK